MHSLSARPSTAILIISTALLCVLPSWSRAQLPTPAEIQADLDNIYYTVAAKPDDEHRGPIMRALEPLMIQQARYLVSELGPWAKDSSVSLLPLLKRTPSSEHGIRPNAHTAKGLAILVRLAPDEVFPENFPRAAARENALKILRYLLRTHGASGETCTDSKPWKNQWQSAYWAALAGEACWLLWDDLTPAERWLAARMVCDEADRFVGQTPPARAHENTAAEENAWNSEIVSLAFNMFKGHPRNFIWRMTATRWILSSYATARDVSSSEIVDKRPLKDWQLDGPNIHDDYTLENHSRVHPDYMACTYLLTSQVPMYAWAKNAVPDAIHRNVEKINAIIKRLATPDGSVVYPNGQDWGLHRNIDWFEFHATMAVLYNDRQSAALMRHSLEAVQRMAARAPGGNGSIYLPLETQLPSDQSMMLEYTAHIYAIMAQLGEGPEPIPDNQLWDKLAHSRIFPAGRFAVSRNTDSIATFSWGAQVMGQVQPLATKDLLLTPEGRGFIGYIVLDGETREAPVTKTTKVAPLAEGFGVSGVISRADGAAEQRFGLLALPDGRVIYADTVVPLAVRKLSRMHLGTLGVLNDENWPYHDGVRTLYYENGHRDFAAKQAATDKPFAIKSPWFNIDGKLGIIRLAATGDAVYEPAPTGAAGRLEQRFHLNTLSPATTARATPGKTISHSVFVLYPNQNAERTKNAAASCKLLGNSTDRCVRLRLDDATEITIDLEKLQILIAPKPPAPPQAADVLALATKVASAHLARPPMHHLDSWMRSVFYSGVLALSETTGNEALEKSILKIAQDLKWQPKPRVYHADDHTIAQVYLELYLRHKNPSMIAPFRERFDYILAHPKTGDIERSKNPEQHSVWSWCDALYMAPPAWAGLARATGNPVYLDFAIQNWWKTSDFLYDRDAHLFHRDSHTMTLREPNGEKMFWGRGNGWVVGGLARLLDNMPENHPERPRFEQQLREMAAALAPLQQPDGLWRSSLLDPAAYPLAETSGSGFFCYALAWGINRGILDRDTYMPVVLRAWQGLVRCVTPDGRVDHAQPIGSGPVNSDPTLTEDYAIGAFLMAACEVSRPTKP